MGRSYENCPLYGMLCAELRVINEGLCLYFRGALFRRLKDFQAAVDDFLTAMDKVSHQQDSDVYVNASKQLVLTYNDFAMECFRQRHFNEAVLLLNKAIKEEKKEKGLYLNRGGTELSLPTAIKLRFNVCIIRKMFITVQLISQIVSIG